MPLTLLGISPDGATLEKVFDVKELTAALRGIRAPDSAGGTLSFNSVAVNPVDVSQGRARLYLGDYWSGLQIVRLDLPFNGGWKFFPENGTMGTILFDSTKMGGDGTYEFYTVGVDVAGNREPAPASADQTAVFNAGTVWTTINSPTEIGEGDAAFDNRNLRISGATVTVNGAHRFQNIELLNGAALTHAETDMTNEYGLGLEAWTLTIDAASSINVDGRGYLGGNRGGNDTSGQTVGNTNGSRPRSGGSYGGLGGVFDGGPCESGLWQFDRSCGPGFRGFDGL